MLLGAVVLMVVVMIRFLSLLDAIELIALV